jgi:hypothetical protein
MRFVHDLCERLRARGAVILGIWGVALLGLSLLDWASYGRFIASMHYR